MPLVSLQDVSVSFGARRLLDSVNLTFAPRTRMAIVGANGSGKTTLMRIAAGEIKPDTGTVVRERETRVSYVGQGLAGQIGPADEARGPWAGATHEGPRAAAFAIPGAPATAADGALALLDRAEQAFSHAHALVAEAARIAERLASLARDSPETDTLLARHAELLERVETSGYHERERRIYRVLGGLGFRPDDLPRPCSSFSAGWRMRIELAVALLQEPDILLLDEPTNYLDLEARGWLESFLRGFSGGFAVVSHDRYFLDVTVSQVAEIWMSRVNVFSGTFTRYETARSRELESIMERYRLQQEEIARVEAFIRRFRYNASKARLVQSRINWLARLERIEVPPVVKRVRFSFPPAPRAGRLAIAVEGLAKSYAGRSVFAAVGFELERGERLAVVGANGAGKSTLLRILAGREPPDRGAVTRGAGVTTALYFEDLADAWTGDRSVIDEIEEVAPTSLIPELRNLLGSFLFRGDDILKPLSVLSGGERSRLALLRMLLRPANLLILDEPTNHLDIASKDVLQEALRDFPGTVVFVSHDRAFLEALATVVLELKDGKATWFVGGYEYYLRKSGQMEALLDSAGLGAVAVSGESARGKGGAGGGSIERGGSGERVGTAERSPGRAELDRAEDKRRKSELRTLERREAEVLEQLEKLDADLGAIEGEMARPGVYSDGERMRALSRQRAENRKNHDRLVKLWEELDAGIARLKRRPASRAPGGPPEPGQAKTLRPGRAGR